MYGNLRIFTNDDDEIDYQRLTAIGSGSVFEPRERVGEVILDFFL